jgi:hypothetical protein
MELSHLNREERGEGGAPGVGRRIADVTESARMAGFGVTDEGFFAPSFVWYSVNNAIPHVTRPSGRSSQGMGRVYDDLNSSILNLIQQIATETPAGVRPP